MENTSKLSLVNQLDFSAIGSIRSTIEEQGTALVNMARNLNAQQYNLAVDLLYRCTGHTIVCGMGKSGHIANKMAATLASTGTPSFFLHPSEAFHGDLGMITADDVVLLISNSGETDEVLQLIPSLKCFGNKIIAITGRAESTLAKNSDAVLLIDIDKETCPNNLAPTTSTTATTAIGDALAVALVEKRDFMPIDFARFHPGGSLGRRLLTKVKDAMDSDKLPLVSPETAVSDAVLTMTNGRHGIAIVVDKHELKGVVTDGDLRRALVAQMNISELKVADIMSEVPVTIGEQASITEAEDLMRDKHIKQLVVLNEQHKVSGILEYFS